MSLPARLYAGAMTLAAPALRHMLHRRQRRGKEIAARLPERWGEDATPRPPGPLLWLHAASVGETMSILPVIEALACTVLLTTGTVTAAALVARRAAAFGPRLLHRFVPLDVPAWVARFLEHWRPDAAGIVESEIWPNLLAACAARRIPVMLVNARLSRNSAAHWQRFPSFARELLGSFALVQAQSEADAARFLALGARRVTSPGNLKFAAPPLPADAAELRRLRGVIGARPVWLAASTHEPEEALIAAAAAALRRRFPDLLTIVAPRHPERGLALARSLRAPRRATGEDPGEAPLWLADTLGELGLLYRLAPIVLVGRSLVAPGGGQNPLEPARLNCAIAVGPYTSNFDGPVAVLEAAGGIARMPPAAAAVPWLTDWAGGMLAEPLAAARLAAAAARAADHAAGLPAETARALRDLLP